MMWLNGIFMTYVIILVLWLNANESRERISYGSLRIDIEAGYHQCHKFC